LKNRRKDATASGRCEGIAESSFSNRKKSDFTENKDQKFQGVKKKNLRNRDVKRAGPLEIRGRVTALEGPGWKEESGSGLGSGERAIKMGTGRRRAIDWAD